MNKSSVVQGTDMGQPLFDRDEYSANLSQLQAHAPAVPSVDVLYDFTYTVRVPVKGVSD